MKATEIQEPGLYVSHLPFFGYGMNIIHVVCREDVYMEMKIVDHQPVIVELPLDHVFLGPLPNPPCEW